MVLEFGRRFLKGNMADKQRNYVFNEMRTLADLVVRLKKVDPIHIKTLSDCVNPENLDVLCDIVRKCLYNVDYNEQSGVCSKESVPRRLSRRALRFYGQRLYKIVEEQLEIRSKHEKFMAIMKTDWTVEVNCAADKSFKIKKVLKEDKMPLVEDIVLHFEEVTSKIKNSIIKLKEKHTAEKNNALTKAVLAYLIDFNSKIPSEVGYTTINNYTTLQASSREKNDETLGVFTVVATKNDVKFPIIVSSVAHTAINTLINHRISLRIQGNLHFSKGDDTAYNGSDLIHKFRSGMPLENLVTLLQMVFVTASQLDPKTHAQVSRTHYCYTSKVYGYNSTFTAKKK